MRKSIKRALSLILAAAILSCSGMFAFALGNSETGYKDLPPFRVNVTYSTQTYSLQVSKSPATVNKTHLYVNAGNDLPKQLASNDNRKMDVDLWEDAPAGDDHVSIYQGSYTGRKLTKFNWIRFETTGNLEFDNTLELYFTFKVGKVSGDDTSATVGSGHIQYNIWVN